MFVYLDRFEEREKTRYSHRWNVTGAQIFSTGMYLDSKLSKTRSRYTIHIRKWDNIYNDMVNYQSNNTAPIYHRLRCHQVQQQFSHSFPCTTNMQDIPLTPTPLFKRVCKTSQRHTLRVTDSKTNGWSLFPMKTCWRSY
jgi:hypothetical protein